MKNFFLEETKWRLIDDHWKCVSRFYFESVMSEPITTEYVGTLADYLWILGFDIPDKITFCLAEDRDYKIKFIHTDGLINVYLKPNNGYK